MKATAPPREYPCLVVLDAGGNDVRHLILGREATIGREPANDVCIPDPLVSKFHAKMIVSNHSVTIFDLGSANKTRLNGQVVSQATVRYGDELQFARVRCRLVVARAEESDQVPEGLSA